MKGNSIGVFFRSLHLWSTQAFVVFILLHLVIVFCTMGYRGPRRITWILGVLMFFFALMEAELGYALRGDFSTQWRALQGADFFVADLCVLEDKADKLKMKTEQWPAPRRKARPSRRLVLIAHRAPQPHHTRRGRKRRPGRGYHPRSAGVDTDGPALHSRRKPPTPPARALQALPAEAKGQVAWTLWKPAFSARGRGPRIESALLAGIGTLFFHENP